jgi:hypothetical protein
LNLRTTYYSREGIHFNQYYGIPEDGILNVAAIEGVLVFEVLDATDNCLGFSRADLSTEAIRTVEIKLDSSPLIVRVVDQSDHGLPGQMVILRCADDCADWSATAITDDDGFSQFLASPEATAIISTGRLPDGVMPSIRIHPSEHKSKPLEIMFGPTCSLEVQIIERGQVRSGVELEILDARTPDRLDPAVTNEFGIARYCRVGLGEWRAKLSFPGYWPQESRIEVDCQHSPIPIEVRRLGGVELVVHHLDGTPAIDASLDLFSQEKRQWASQWLAEGLVSVTNGTLRTDHKGQLRITGAPNGPYDWQVILPDGGTIRGELLVPPVKIVPIELICP